MERSVFYISDGTAITAEVLGHAVLSQFPVKATTFTLPFVESAARAQEVCEKLMKYTAKPVSGRWFSIR